MLSKAEANLVQRDPVVPGLATLLDTEAFVDALSWRLPAADVRSARITYIKYKPRTNCLVGYRLDLAGTTVAATAKAYRRNAPLPLPSAQSVSAMQDAWSSGRLVLDDCGVLISVFPHDRKIKSLRRLPDAEARRRMIRRVAGRHRSFLQEGAIEELAYKPERRYVAKVCGSQEPWVVFKFYTERNYRAARNSSGAFDACGMLRLAPRIGNSDRYGVLAYEWLPGQLLSEAMLDPNFDAHTLRTVGLAIAELHAQHPSGLDYRAPETEASALVSEAERLAFLCPHLSERVRGLAQKLANRLMDETAMSGPIHGDLHAGQILIDGGNVGLLDLDRATRANPMADVGLFIAHLDREVLRGKLASSRVDQLAASFLEGYFHRRPSSTSAVQLYRAAALLQLSPECFRLNEPNWPGRIEDTLRLSQELVDGETGRL